MTELTPQQQNQIDRARAMLAGLRNRSDGPGQHTRLDAGALGPDASVPTWVQIATAGNYRGYAGGAFVFDARVFGQIIANFRNHPSYAGGSADVIPWDFNHASASFAADGSIPITGTPAQGWIQELNTRVGPDGVLQLWALTRWLEPARSYIKSGSYKWASVVVGFDCTDAKSGANIGAVLESVALTNNPFIEGMTPLIAASRGAGLAPSSKGDQMSLTLSRAPDGSIRLAAPKAEIGPNNGHLADSAGDNPALKYLPSLDGNRYQEILSAARKAGMVGAQPETLAAWLRAQGADVERELATADPHRMAMIVGTILRTLAIESMPVGSNVPQPTPIPTELSRQPSTAIDARSYAGRNRVERACLALRAAQPGFGTLAFDEQLALAGAALRSGRVLA